MLKQIKRNPEIVWRVEVEEEELLKRAKNGEDISEEPMVTLIIADMVHQLNYVASKIWLLADGSRSEDDIISEILKSFSNEDEKVIIDDIRFFLNRLLKEGWLICDRDKNS